MLIYATNVKRIEIKPGNSYARGYTKGVITLLLMENNGIGEPRLRDLVREITGVRENRGIKKHLKDLEDKKIIFKESEAGKSNKWYFNESKFNFLEFFKRCKHLDLSLWFSRQEIWLEQVESIFDIIFNNYVLGPDEVCEIERDTLSNLNSKLESFLVEFRAFVEKCEREKIFSVEDIKKMKQEDRKKWAEMFQQMSDGLSKLEHSLNGQVGEIMAFRYYLKMILCISPSAQEFLLNLSNIDESEGDRLLRDRLKISQLEICGENIKCSLSDFYVSFLGCLFLDNSKYGEKDFFLSASARTAQNILADRFPKSLHGIGLVSERLEELLIGSARTSKSSE